MTPELEQPNHFDPAFNFFNRNEDPIAIQRELQIPASGSIRRILIHFAMDEEAQPFLVATGARRASITPDRIGAEGGAMPRIYTYTRGSVEYFIATNGVDDRFGVAQVGTGPSGTAVLLSAISVKPDLIVNAGTAGGFMKRGGGVGDVYLGTGAVFHDHRIPLPHYREYGRGFYPTTRTSAIQSVLELKQGVVTTGGSLDCSAEDAAEIDLLGASVKDMEAAEVARVAITLKVPFLTFKAVTDVVDDPTAKTPEQFQANFAYAVAQLTERLLGLEHFLARDSEPLLESL